MEADKFRQYCNLVAANVLNKQGKTRFSYGQLSDALNSPDTSLCNEVQDLYTKCLAAAGLKPCAELRLTLLNINAAWLMITGDWKFPLEQQGTSECGFEIF
jgi:hypothetical protein